MIPAIQLPRLESRHSRTLGLDAATAERIIQENHAIATIKFPDLKALKSFMDSKENKEQLAPDGPRYTSEIKQRVSVGVEWLGIESGESMV